MLQCPATLLIARHGDATYAGPHGPADAVDRLTSTGRQQILTLASSVADRNIAAVYSSTTGRAVESAEVAAAQLGLKPRQEAGLEELQVAELDGQPYGSSRWAAIYDDWAARELDASVPGGECGRDVLTRMQEALQGIADLHRGETVLVISHGGVMAFAIPRIVENVGDRYATARYLPNAVPAVVEAGDDGWRLLSWPGSSDARVA